MKVSLSQVLKFKSDATGKVDLSRFGYVGGCDIKQLLKYTNSREEWSDYQPLKIKMHSDGTRSIVSSPLADIDLRTDIATSIKCNANYSSSYHD